MLPSRAKSRAIRRSLAQSVLAHLPTALVLGQVSVALALPPAGLVLGEGPILHERFDGSPETDRLLGRTTVQGALPGQLRTRSGIVSAPENVGPARAIYRLDNYLDTPASLSYDEPFRPRTMPFKRLFAFDELAPDLSLRVADDTLRLLRPGGAPRADEDTFFADFTIEMVPNQPVRIASVASGARIVAVETTPRTAVEILKDSAENWFARGPHAETVHLVLQLAAPRRAFGGAFRIGNAARVLRATALPRPIEQQADKVLRRARVTQAMAPSDALAALVAYFRAFDASPQTIQASSDLELYAAIALEQKGLCRHRAFAFFITAIRYGFATRMVHNEAHAWVEVFDGEHFVRIDLGGAEVGLALPDNVEQTPRHRSAPDGFGWPKGRQPSERVFEEAARSPQPSALGAPAVGQKSLPKRAERPGAPVELNPVTGPLDRGEPLTLSGKVTSVGTCARSRVDIWFQPDSDANAVYLGALATDLNGSFTGTLIVPRSLPVGPGELYGSAPGCGP
jgi:hypothetical protein